MRRAVIAAQCPVGELWAGVMVQVRHWMSPELRFEWENDLSTWGTFWQCQTASRMEIWIFQAPQMMVMMGGIVILIF